MIRASLPISLLAAIAATSIACGGERTTTPGGGNNTGRRNDASTSSTADAGRRDAASPDFGIGVDIGFPPDTGIHPDAGSNPDAAPGQDAVSNADATPNPDATPGQDAAPNPDATPAPDAAPNPDAGPGDTGLPDQPPRVSFLAPTAGQTLSGRFNVRAMATDDRGVSRVEFYANGTLLGLASAAPYELAWDTTMALNGAYQLRAVATDTGGLTAMAMVDVVVRNTGPMGDNPPSISLINPVNGSSVCGQFTIEAAATDDVGVMRVQFFLDGNLLGMDESAPYTFAWNTTTVQDGMHTLRAVATDTRNQGTQDTIGFMVQNQGRTCDNRPSVAITSPSTPYIRSTMLQIDASATDDVGVLRVQFFVDNALINEDSMFPYSTTFNAAQVAEGPHTIKALAYDTANQTGEQTIQVTFDRTNPMVSITSPIQSAIINGSTLDVMVSATDSSGIERVELTLDGSSAGSVRSAPYLFSIASVRPGAHTLRATAYDLAGNSAQSTTISVVVDLPPMVAITAPTAMATVRGTVAISANAVDETGVQDVTFSVDGTMLAVVTSPPYQTSWNTLMAPNGSHVIAAVARDTRNQTSRAEVTVTVSDAAPTVAITSPTANQTVRGTVNITANATDDLTVTGVEFFVGATSLGTISSPPYTVAWNTTAVPNGMYQLAAVARDSHNQTTRAMVNVNVLDAAPAVSITAPTANSTVRGTTTVRANATDDIGVSQVELLYGTTRIGLLTSPPYETVWDTSVLPNGMYQLVAIATDTKGQTTRAMVNVNVTDSPPTVSFTSPTAGSRVRGVVNFTANATDDLGVDQVEFFFGAQSLGVDDLPPYTASADLSLLPNGNATFRAVATDTKGQTTTAMLTLIVDDAPPTVAITAPTSGAQVRGTITIRANATDDVGVNTVAFVLDGATPLGTISTAPYEVQWNALSVAVGAHTISAVATDTKGQATTTMVPITVVDTVPTVVITAPLANAPVSGNFTFSANVTDDVAVSSVDLRLGNVSLGRLTTPPFSARIPSCVIPDGPQTLTVEARDQRNQIGTAMITVNVSNRTAAPVLTGAPTTFMGMPASRLGFATSCDLTGGSGWSLYYSTTPGVTVASPSFSIADSGYTHTNLMPNTTYYYRVAAVFGAMESALSNEVAVLSPAGIETETNNDLASATVVTASTAVMSGSINPGNDVDLYRVDLPAAGWIAATVWIPYDGSCAGPENDTILRLYNAAGTELGNDDDGGIAPCSSINPEINPFANLAAGTYYLRVEAKGLATVIPEYTLVVKKGRAGCGNGVMEVARSEQCDDGNTIAGDGCSATCVWEGRAEVESNNTRTTANAINLNPWTSIGAVSTNTDQDWYAITVGAGSNLEAFVTVNGDSGCPSTADPRAELQLYNSAGTSLGVAPYSFNCPLFDPATNALVRNMAAGTYYLRVIEVGQNTTIARYYLNVTVYATGCGNGIVEGMEQCDDGNAVDLDGCTNSCSVQVTGTVVPPAPLVVGVEGPGTRRYVQLNVMGGQSITATVADAGGTACTFDTNVTLFSPSFAALGNDVSDGPGKCAAIRYPADTWATNLAAGTYYLGIGTDSSIGGNTEVRVSLINAVCGNRRVETNAGEACDDGNTTNGDGCSALCQRESLMEVEPNNSTAQANPTNLNGAGMAVIPGAISPVNDNDYFVFTVPMGQSLRFTARTYGAMGNYNVCNGDSIIDLLSSTGTSLATDDDGAGVGTCSLISAFGPLTAGTYYVRVRPYNTTSATFNYFLDITLQ